MFALGDFAPGQITISVQEARRSRMTSESYVKPSGMGDETRAEMLPLRRRLGHAALRLVGWQLDVSTPLPPRCVLVGAHHTSSSDFYLGMLLLWATGIRIRWAAKDTLFWGPLGLIMRGLGGVPINRRQRTGFVSRMAAAMEATDEFRLAILPEGTRRRAEHWKTGFYHIAELARVPIFFAYADYERRVIGWAPGIVPTGDIDADFAVIRAFYAHVRPRYPALRGEVRPKPAAEHTPANGSPNHM